MANTKPDPLVHEFAPPAGYVTFLWILLLCVQVGLIYVFWLNPWYSREVLDTTSRVVWLGFDAILLVGATHATRLRVRVDDEGLEYLNWNFRRTRMEWDEVTRMVRKTNFLGSRYGVWAGRRAFWFTTVSLGAAPRLAAFIAERADLDDLGEVAMSVQAGTVHVWQHPSAMED